MALTGRHDYENMLCWLPEIDTNYYGIPEIKGITELPEDAYFTNSEFLRKNKDYNSWCMFYEYDYKFERVWKQPKRQAKWLSNFKGAISPNFSVYIDIPLAMALWSVYKARWCGAYWESLGIPVIPDVSWGNKNTWDFCFEGLPKNSVVSVQDVGNHEDGWIRDLWLDGFNEMIKRLEPSKILIYGAKAKDLPEYNIQYINAKVNNKTVLGKE